MQSSIPTKLIESGFRSRIAEFDGGGGPGGCVGAGGCVGTGVGVGASVGVGDGVAVAVGFGRADWAVVGLPQETRRTPIRSITPNETNRCARELVRADLALFSGKCHINRPFLT